MKKIILVGVFLIIGVGGYVTFVGKGCACGSPDAPIKSTLNNARVQAELYFDANGSSYADVCTQNVGSIKGVADFLTSAKSADSAQVDCASSEKRFAIQAQLKSNNNLYYCIDSLSEVSTTSPFKSLIKVGTTTKIFNKGATSCPK